MLAAGTPLAFGGCNVTNAQLWDFGRTEVARVISDTLGQTLFRFLVSTSQNPNVFQ